MEWYQDGCHLLGIVTHIKNILQVGSFEVDIDKIRRTDSPYHFFQAILMHMAQSQLHAQKIGQPFLMHHQ